jgi:alpha-tubulin suppressor-like RCC1 family protein
VGESHFVAVLGNGILLGAGSNEFGQLGLPFKGGNAVEVVESPRILDLEGLNTVKDNV